jgi:hypothetical protein
MGNLDPDRRRTLDQPRQKTVEGFERLGVSRREIPRDHDFLGRVLCHEPLI